MLGVDDVLIGGKILYWANIRLISLIVLIL